MHKILLIDGDPNTNLPCKEKLEYTGFEVDLVCDSFSAMQVLETCHFQLILMDLNLPDGSGGTSLVTQIQNDCIYTPIVALTSNDDITSKLEFFSLGGVDYIVKPVHSDELVARCKNIIRLTKGFTATTITVGALTLDVDNRKLFKGIESVDLSPKEFSLLEVFVSKVNRVLSRENILDAIYGGIDEPEVKQMDVYILKLRKKLSLVFEGGDKYIETVRGHGYRFVDPNTIGDYDETIY